MGGGFASWSPGAVACAGTGGGNQCRRPERVGVEDHRRGWAGLALATRNRAKTAETGAARGNRGSTARRRRRRAGTAPAHRRWCREATGLDSRARRGGQGAFWIGFAAKEVSCQRPRRPLALTYEKAHAPSAIAAQEQVADARLVHRARGGRWAGGRRRDHRRTGARRSRGFVAAREGARDGLFPQSRPCVCWQTDDLTNTRGLCRGLCLGAPTPERDMGGGNARW